jgi:hypothetical protein
MGSKQLKSVLICLIYEKGTDAAGRLDSSFGIFL